MSPVTALDLGSEARSAVLVAAFGLLLFLVALAVFNRFGWVPYPFVPVTTAIGILAAGNFVLAVRPRAWSRGPWVAWVYEGYHAAVLTLVLYWFGGVSVGVFLPIYGFLVVHTEVLRPDASPFVTANLCALCYATLAAVEASGVARPAGTLALTLTPGARVAFVLFATLCFNFLALYAQRHGRQLRELAGRLERMVAERTAELTRSNRYLAATAAALEAKQREVQTFAYSVTHDLKNPLNAILLLADLLLRREGAQLSPEGRAEPEQIARTAEGGEDMIRDLFGVFRITTLPETPGWVSLDNLLAHALEPLQPRIAAKRIRVETEALPPVWGDETKLGHLVGNLLSNAVKYVAAGTGLVRVCGERRNGRVHLTVEDNGIGIPPAYHGAVFELFGRVPREQQLVDGVSVSGSGVGLALARRIAEMHGGHLRIDSAPGRGSRFEVDLPATDPTEGDGA